MNLEIGSPLRKVGWQTIDIRGTPDIVWNLNDYPYPFVDDGIFDMVKARHVLEHLDDPLKVMQEIHRILKKGGVAIIIVPHGVTTSKNPAHKHDFEDAWFKAFDKSGSKYNNNTIGGMFKVDITLKMCSIKIWRPHEITARMIKR